MASVTGMTAEKIDQLMDDMIIGVEVDDNGQLIYERRSGEKINAGQITSSTAAVEQAWPVHSLFITTVPTNPATLLGVGTWARFGKGRTLVSLDEDQEEFNAAQETGGEKTVTLTTQQIPSHTHTTPAHTHTIPPHTHTLNASYDTGTVSPSGTSTRIDQWSFGTARTTQRSGTTGSGGGGSTDASNEGVSGNTGGGQAHNNMPPYVVVYIWKRTA